MNDKSGVYVIVNGTNGKRYVGSSINLRVRWREHKRRLRRGDHDNQHLLAAWNKYGSKAFWFKILFFCSKSSLIEMEQLAMDAIAPEYNIAPVAGSRLGLRHSEETKAKISASVMGHKTSEDTKLKLSMANKGHKYNTPEVRAKISVALKGKNRAKTCSLRVVHGPHSVETRAKMSAALTGRTLSAEHIANMSKALKGRKLSEAHKANISAALKGKKHTSEANRS